MTQEHHVTFGLFRLEPAPGRLWHGDHLIPLAIFKETEEESQRRGQCGKPLPSRGESTARPPVWAPSSPHRLNTALSLPTHAAIVIRKCGECSAMQARVAL